MNFTTSDILFHLFAGIATISALLVVFMPNPIYSAFFLALVMSVLGAFFFMLDAPFLAVAQILVYAGAVMVLFTMVMMLFDLKKDMDDMARLSPVTFLKITGAGILCGILMGMGWLVSHDGAGMIRMATEVPVANQQVVLKNLGNAPTNAMTNPEELKDEVDEITQNKQAGKDLFKDYSETQKLSVKLFSKFVFAFEILSVLLLVAIVGAVALAKSKGGTHHVIRRP